MGQRYCSVPGCHSYFKRDSFLGVTFHRFPSNPDRKRSWIQAIRRKKPDGSPWDPGHSARVCSLHFIGQKKCNDPDSPSYVPTIFPTHKVRINPMATKRYQRKQKTLDKTLTVRSEEQNETIYTAKVLLRDHKEGDEEEETESAEPFDQNDQPVPAIVWSHKAVQTTEILNSDDWGSFEWQHEAFPAPRGKWSVATQVCIPF